MAKIGVRVWILIIALALALLAVSPTFKTGVVITSVERNSTAFNEGLRQGMIIEQVNEQQVADIEDYASAVRGIFYQNTAMQKVIIKTNTEEIVLFANETPEITVGKIPKTRIKTGLDLSGGARALLRAENHSLTETQANDLVDLMSERLNVYGIKDVAIRPVRDLLGDYFILVEIAGATPSDIETLLANQGKFEAKIGNVSVFTSDTGDISDICKNDAKCSGIRKCDPAQQGGYFCSFDFTIYLNERAAKHHAAVTRNLTTDETGNYLSEKLFLYIDGTEVSSLFISTGLRGIVTTEISIQGSGSGATQETALEETRREMKRLQTILQTGSLPYKLEIVKLDTISPLLGQEFARSLLLLALVVFAIVSLALFVRYRKIKITLSVIFTMFSEALITLGIAAFINWNLDAPSIAGIIAGMGTGVNDQIVIIDESVSNRHVGIGERIKRALFIILGAFATIVVAMIPLFWAGAGLLRGFALTTIIGVTVGILITRPAFAEIIRKLED